ncbi:MAG: hypothetical protein CMP47_09755 [Rickettsiales bacterium]|jgi:hypothetical protein|nr:hypothetical protein [Rickettsiales bacterium]
MRKRYKPPIAQTFTAFIIAFVGSKVLFYLIDFNYSLFKDPFNLGKFLTDIGVFFGFFFIGMVVYNLFTPNKRKS